MADKVRVKYTGGADNRTIYKKDFQNVGVEDQDVVHFDMTGVIGGDVQEVSEAAAKHLTERDTFEMVKEDAVTVLDDSGTNDDDKGDPQADEAQKKSDEINEAAATGEAPEGGTTSTTEPRPSGAGKTARSQKP